MKKINCPSCGTQITNTLEAYAGHILKKHSGDIELCAWANEELMKIGKGEESIVKKPRFMGKLLDRIPPARKKELPEYIKRQIGE